MTQIPIINVNTLRSLKFKPLPSFLWKHEEEIFVNDTEILNPQPYLKIRPST